VSDKSPDANVESVRRQLLDRSKAGLSKYGVTTERTDLTAVDWVTHAQQEAMDLSIYLERLKTELSEAQTLISYLLHHHDRAPSGDCWTDCKACRAHKWIERNGGQ
jgi:hypothetical protein